MIKVDGRKVCFQGSAATLMAEYCFLTEYLVEQLAENYGQEDAEEFIKQAFEDGVKYSKEDHTEILKKKLQEMIDKL